MILLRLPTLLAAVLALLLARRLPRHRPVAAALAGAWLADACQDVPMPALVTYAAYQLLPVLSAWCALRVLGGVRPDPAALLAMAAWIAAVLFELDPRAAHVLATFVQIGAVARWWRSPAPRGAPELCALVLLAGDVVGLVSPLMLGEREREDWWLVSSQAAIVGAGLVVLQARALRSPHACAAGPAGTSSPAWRRAS